MPVKNKDGLTLSLEELEVKSENSWESNNDEKAAKKIVNKHLVRLLNFIPGNLLDLILPLPVLLHIWFWHFGIILDKKVFQ